MRQLKNDRFGDIDLIAPFGPKGPSLGRFRLRFVDSVLGRRRDIPEFRLHALGDFSFSHTVRPNFLVEFVQLRDVCQETIVGRHIRLLLT